MAFAPAVLAFFAHGGRDDFAGFMPGALDFFELGTDRITVLNFNFAGFPLDFFALGGLGFAGFSLDFFALGGLGFAGFPLGFVALGGLGFPLATVPTLAQP